MFSLPSITIGCNVKKFIAVQIMTIILLIIFKMIIFKDTIARSIGESFALIIIGFAVWVGASFLTVAFDCAPFIGKDCDKILRNAYSNKCTTTDLPDVIIL